MNNSLLNIHTEGGITTLTLQRFSRRNALCRELMDTLAAALQEAEENEDCRVVILRGENNVFCAGSDLSVLAQLDAVGMTAHEENTARVVRALASFSKPTIAVVEGYALGGGFALAIACDYVIASHTARLGMPEVRNGWIPPWGLTLLSSKTTPARARKIVWGAEAITTTTLCEWGIVDHLTEPGEEENKALEIAQSLASFSSDAVSTTKLFFQKPFSAQDADLWCGEKFRQQINHPNAQATFTKFKKS